MSGNGAVEWFMSTGARPSRKRRPLSGKPSKRNRRPYERVYAFRLWRYPMDPNAHMFCRKHPGTEVRRTDTPSATVNTTLGSGPGEVGRATDDDRERAFGSTSLDGPREGGASASPGKMADRRLPPPHRVVIPFFGTILPGRVCVRKHNGCKCCLLLIGTRRRCYRRRRTGTGDVNV